MSATKHCLLVVAIFHLLLMLGVSFLLCAATWFLASEAPTQADVILVLESEIFLYFLLGGAFLRREGAR